MNRLVDSCDFLEYFDIVDKFEICIEWISFLLNQDFIDNKALQSEFIQFNLNDHNLIRLTHCFDL